MAPDPSSQSHLPPAWPEAPRDDASGWSTTHRDGVPGWPEPPRHDPVPGQPHAARADAPPPRPGTPHGDPGPDHGGPRAAAPLPAWSPQAPRPPVPPAPPPLEDDGLGTVQGPLPPRPATSDVNYEKTVSLPMPPRPEGGPPPGHRQGPGPLPAPPAPSVPHAPAPSRHGRHAAPQGPHPDAPGGQPGPSPADAPRPPGGDLGRDPADPYRPFVTAGQISGPKTPPPQRQQELWNTVFGENYQEIGEEEDLDRPGGRVWIYALAGSAAVALIVATVWAFLAGPLAAEDGATTAQPSVVKSTPPKVSQPIGRLPRFKGKASPVIGTLVDQDAAITVPRLGAPWRLDERPTVRTVYGYHTRQYVRAGTDATGRVQYAQVMSGPLAKPLTSKYTSPDNLNPVISAVAYQARLKFFAKGNTIRKTAQQSLTVDGMPGRLIAYEVTAGQTKTTMVVAAVITGADYPAIVYMSIPESRKQLLPDINTVVKQMRLATP